VVLNACFVSVLKRRTNPGRSVLSGERPRARLVAASIVDSSSIGWCLGRPTTHAHEKRQILVPWISGERA
jgi:hypothetical protein